MGALILLAYVAGALFGWWYMTPLLSRAFAYGDPDLGDRVFGSFVALTVALFWPVALPILFMAMRPRVTDADRKSQVEAQERRIRDLECELRLK